jgi:hypothetical protein
MSKPLPTQNTFANVTPPWNLVQLDANTTALWAAINDVGTYSNTLLDTGVVNAMVVTPITGTTLALAQGLCITVIAANTTTSSTVTLNANGTGAKSVLLSSGVVPTAGAIVAAGIYAFAYDGSSWRLLNPSAVATPAGSWTTTISGAFSSNPSGTLKYRVDNGIAVVWAEANITGASVIPGTLTCSGLPAAVTPSANRILIAWGGWVRGVNCPMTVTVTTSNTILLAAILTVNAVNPTGVTANPANPFDGSSTAGIFSGFTITYPL